MALPVNHPSAQPLPARDRIWFSPNTASVDMLEMFSAPDQWSFARARIDVFKFSVAQVGSGGWGCQLNPAQICGENYLENLVNVDAFSKLGQWGIGIGIESFFAGPVVSMDPVECTTVQQILNLTLNGSINVIQNVEANGGIVRYLAMDEPMRQWFPAYYYLYTGQTDPRPCLVDSLEILADHVAAYILQMESWFPEILIGHIELYPEVSVDQLKEWIVALEARGISLSFLHLDVNGPRVDQYNSWGITTDIAVDCMELKWEENEYGDQSYYDGMMDWINFFESTNVELDHYVIQSWVWPYYTTGPGPKEIPVNLPEDDPSIYSHTRLINDALAVITDAEMEPLSDWTMNSRLHQNHPNPFNPSTTITYYLPENCSVLLEIFDVSGRRLVTLISGSQEKGQYEVDWNGQDQNGNPVSSGTYFYRLKAGKEMISRKMVLLR